MNLLIQKMFLPQLAVIFLFSILLNACGGSSGSNKDVVGSITSSSAISSSRYSASASTSSAAIDPASLEVNVTPVARNYYGAMHEPEQGILHGAGQDIDGFKDYSAAVGEGNHPVLYMTYVSIVGQAGDINWWGENLIRELSSLPSDVIPQIGLNFSEGINTGGGRTAAVVNGDYDEQITAVVKAIKNLQRKNFVRIGYEFEGSWNGYGSEKYALAYKKIAKALRDGNTNSATVWCSAGGFAGFQPWSKLAAYYPGDDYVDWFGIDVFAPSEIVDPRLVTFLQKADEHKKPVMIGETSAIYVGTRQGQYSWEQWFRPFYTLLYQNPQIKAFSYISWDWVYWSNQQNFDLKAWGDTRIEVNPIVNFGVKQELKKTIFINSVEK